MRLELRVQGIQGSTERINTVLIGDDFDLQMLGPPTSS